MLPIADDQPEQPGLAYPWWLESGRFARGVPYSREACGCSLCAPEAYEVPPGTHPGGLRVVGDYPSVWAPPHAAPQYLLLDTCVVQNLLWAREQAAPIDDDAAWQSVNQRYGRALGQELRAVAGLLKGVEALCEASGAGIANDVCPFVVTRSSWHELLSAPGPKGGRLMAEWRLWRSRSETFHPDTWEAVPDAVFTLMPEDAGWPAAGQDCLPGLDDGYTSAAAFGPFPQAGDRRLIHEALRFGIPAILTTDLKTFWRHRAWLYKHGVEVWRPSDFCWALLNDLLRWNGEGIDPVWPMRPLAESSATVVDHQNVMGRRPNGSGYGCSEP